MSYILESIKKSDKERQSMQASPVLPETSLHALNPSPDAFYDSARPRWRYVGLFLVLLLLCGGWWYQQQNDNHTEHYHHGLPLVHANENEGGSDSHNTVPPIEQSPMAPPIQEAPTALDLGENAKVTVSPVSPMQTPPASGEALSLYRSLPNNDKSTSLLEVSSKTIQLREIRNDQADKQVSSLYRQQSEMADHSKKATVNNNHKSKKIAPQQLTVINNKALSKGNSDVQIPSIYDLSISTRDTIPAIHYGAHIYASDNKSGFVILNGAKRQAGDQLSGGVYVEKVESSAVVLSYQGVVFSLPAMKSWQP